MNTTINWTKKISKIKSQIDKQIAWAPHVKTIYLLKKDYEEVVKLIPDDVKNFMQGNPVYRDREIRLYGAKNDL